MHKPGYIIVDKPLSPEDVAAFKRLWEALNSGLRVARVYGDPVILRHLTGCGSPW